VKTGKTSKSSGEKQIYRITYLQNGLRCSLFSITLVLADHFGPVSTNCHSKLIFLVTECVDLIFDEHLTKTEVPEIPFSILNKLYIMTHNEFHSGILDSIIAVQISPDYSY
jgi:hypothetical protein